MNRKIIKDAAEMTKNIPAKDVLVPMQTEDVDLAPYPKIEYMIIEATSIEKVIRDVNTQLQNGRQAEGGITVSSGPVTKFYQTMVRRNVDGDADKTIHIPGLEDEPDLYEDVEGDVDR